MRLAFSCSFAFACSVALAAPVARVVRTTSAIDVVNVATNSEVTISNTTFATNSLAMDPGGSMFSANAAGDLFNVTAPVPFLIGSTGFTQIADLDYAPGGFWGYSNSSQNLFFFDTSSSSVTYTASIPNLAAYSITGVAFRPSDGSIFLSGNVGFNQDLLFVVPPSSNSFTILGPMPNADPGSYFSDIDFDASGTLYAMNWYHRDFYTVSTTNGATSLVSAGPHRDVTGMALPPAAVPEPTSLAALGLGGFALMRRRK